MITPADLTTLSRQDLAELAKQSGVAEYRTLKKPQLIAAIRDLGQSALTKTKAASTDAVSKAKAKQAGLKAGSAEKATAPRKASSAAAKHTESKAADTKKAVAKASKPTAKAVQPATVAKRPASPAKPVAAKPTTDKSRTVKPTVASSLARAMKAPAEKPASTKPVSPKTSARPAAPKSKPDKVATATSGRSENVKGKVAAKSNEVSSPRGAEKTKSQPAAAANASRTVRPLQAVAPIETASADTASFPKRKLAAGPSIGGDRMNAAKKIDAAASGKPERREATPSSVKKSPPPTPKPAPASKSSAKAAAAKKPAAPPAPPISAKSARIRREMALRSARAAQNKDISTDVLIAGSAVRVGGAANGHSPHKDRVVLLVRDCFWLQADWEITRAAVDRVRVAMAEKWHNSIPILRLMSVADAAANRAEQIVRDIPIHGGVSSWYIDVDEPPSRYRVIIGYVADNERFFPICRSNVVETPRPGAANQIDEHWRDIAEDYERIYSLSGGLDSTGGSDDLKELFEDRLKRTMPTRADSSNAGSETDAALDRHRSLPFEVDAELIIYGSTVPGATVMLGGEPVKLRPDGSFTIRVALPDKRQVFPVVAQSRDGMRQRTTVVAVERNTKVMEAVDRDSNF